MVNTALAVSRSVYAKFSWRTIGLIRQAPGEVEANDAATLAEDLRVISEMSGRANYRVEVEKDSREKEKEKGKRRREARA